MEPQKKILVVFDFDQTLTIKHFGKTINPNLFDQLFLSATLKKHRISKAYQQIRDKYVDLYKKKYHDNEYTYVYTENENIETTKNITDEEINIYNELFESIINDIGGYDKKNYRNPDELTTYLNKLKDEYGNENIIFCILSINSPHFIIKIVEKIYPKIFDPTNINFERTLAGKQRGMQQLLKHYKPQFVIFFDDDKTEIENVQKIQKGDITIKSVLVNKDVVDSKIDFTDFVKQNINELLGTTTGGKKSKRHRTTNRRKSNKK